MKAKSRIFLIALKNACTGLNSFFFLNGFLLCLILYSSLEDQYEKETFDSLNAYILKSFNGAPVNEDSVVIKSLHLTSSLEAAHRKAFSAAEVGGFIAKDLHPISFDFTTGQGACGSSALVLGRLMLTMNYEMRFAHMEAGGVYGAHNVLEVKANNRWVVLDPLYDLYFVRPDGRLAGFEDVRSNWAYYKLQTPPGYNMGYRYASVTYTNWSKIPVIMPAVKSGLNLMMGRERADAISLRPWFLRKFHCLMIVFLLLEVAVAAYTVILFFRQRKASVHLKTSYRGLESVVQPGKQLLVS